MFFLSDTTRGQMRQIYVDSKENNEIWKFSFYSPSEGYVAFTDWVGYTTDSGRTFIKKPITLSNVDYNGYVANVTFGFGINGVKAFSKDTIIVYGHYGFVPAILYSVNQGNSFKLVYQSVLNPNQLTKGVLDMSFTPNPNIGYAVEADRIIKTTNKGQSWTQVRSDPNSLFDQVQAIDANVVYALSTNYAVSKLLKSSDGGGSWATITLPMRGRIGSGFFLTANKGWLNMIHPDTNLSWLYYTSNGGQNWALKNSADATSLSIKKIRFINDSTGFANEDLFNVYKTSDSGRIWEPLPRNNQYEYLGYGHNDLFLWNNTQLWAGGGHGFLELNTSPGALPLPNAFFSIDTSGVSRTGVVNLVNYSKPNYQYKWFVNNVLVSTSYQASYVHNFGSTLDSVKLVVIRGNISDTLVKYQTFGPSVTITSFDPVLGTTGTVVTIRGKDLSLVTQVWFGNKRAASFSIISDTEIRAIVRDGASGSVTLLTDWGSASLPGFTYLPAPVIDLPVSIGDTILCKSEPVTLTIQNTENDVKYELIDEFRKVYGSVNGNGSSVSMTTIPISTTGYYHIRASRLNIVSVLEFKRKEFILVEQTKSIVVPTRINVQPGEKLDFFNRSPDAATFAWTFNEDASSGSSLVPHPQQISYASVGQKTVKLISTSTNGCKDTLLTDAVFVYQPSSADASCFVEAVNDEDFDYFFESPAEANKITKTGDSGYIITGRGNDPAIRSEIGRSKELFGKGVPYAAKFKADGALSWLVHIKRGGWISGSATDQDGNVFIIGACDMRFSLTLPNGDSMQLAATNEPIYSYSRKYNGFLLKLDPTGKYLWHRVFNNPLPEYGEINGGNGGVPTHIIVKNDRIVVAGNSASILTLWQNGTEKTIVKSTGVLGDLAREYFITSLNINGEVLWGMTISNSSNNYLDAITGFDVDRFGNIYVSGNREHRTVVTDATGAVFDFVGQVASKRSYVFKMNNAGKVVWNVRFASNYGYGDHEIGAMDADEDGNVYLTGYNKGSVETDYFTLTQSDGSERRFVLYGMFILKMDQNGFSTWCLGNQQSSTANGVAIRIDGKDLFVAARLIPYRSDKVDLLISSVDGSEVFMHENSSAAIIANYDTSGILKKLVSTGSNSEGYVIPNELQRDSKGNLLISGIVERWTRGTGTYTMFGDSLQMNGTDAFYAKLNVDLCRNDIVPTAVAGPDRTQCPSIPTRLGAAVSGDSYTWVSFPSGFRSNEAQPLVAPDTTTTYILTVLNSSGLVARDTVVVKVPDISRAKAGPDQSVCAGSSITLGTPAVPGLSYVWSADPAGFSSNLASPVVTASKTTSYILAVSDQSGCVKKDTVRIEVIETQIPSVTISASRNPFCGGTVVSFTSTAINAGDAPVFQWRNKNRIVGEDSSGYTTYALDNGDEISVSLTSSLGCATPKTVTSNIIKLTAIAIVRPTIKIVGTTKFENGQAVNLSLDVTGGGANPSYQWEDSTSIVGWSNIAGATSSTLSYTPAKAGDKLRCKLTSNAVCASPSVLFSNTVMFDVVTAVTSPSAANAGNVVLFPNPATNQITVDSLKINDRWETLEVIAADGSVVKKQVIKNARRVTVPMDNMRNGMYMIVLRRKNGAPLIFKVIKM